MTRKINREHIRKLLARRTLADFALYTDHRYRMNWHHALLCEYLDRFIAKEITRLMVFMPPRYGKSELVSRKLPAFIFGQNPDAHIIATSYSADLAQRFRVRGVDRFQPLGLLVPQVAHALRLVQVTAQARRRCSNPRLRRSTRNRARRRASARSRQRP